MVTALVSAYYSENFIGARIQNLLAQVPTPEIVVICQRDSAEHKIIMSDFKRHRIILVLTPDIPTLYKAWNLGIEAATGEYLTSANTDDLFYPGALDAMARHMDEHKCSLLCGDCDIQIGGEISSWKRRIPPLTHDYCTIGSMPMWRKDIHGKYGMFDESMKVCGDFDFWLRLLDGGESICHMDKTVGLYWRREDSIEHRNHAAMQKENKAIRERLVK